MPNEWFQMDEWSPVYYNKADSAGLGFNRSATGSNLVGQYFPLLQQRYGNIDTTPENLLAWFHHMPWDRTMSSGRPFWDELVYRYQMGVQYVTWMRETWDTLEASSAPGGSPRCKAKLAQHETDAASWRDTSVSYLREFSGRDIPTDNGPLSAKIVVNGKTIGGFNLVGRELHASRWPRAARRRSRRSIPADPAAHRADRLARPRRARPGRGEGLQDRLLRPDRQELRVQPRAGHDAAQPARQRPRDRSSPT